MPSDPVSAGRKGGKSKSEKKIAACKRNGFQKQQPAPAPVAPAAPRPLFVPTKEQS
jgi:hypothetical protein